MGEGWMSNGGSEIDFRRVKESVNVHVGRESVMVNSWTARRMGEWLVALADEIDMDGLGERPDPSHMRGMFHEARSHEVGYIDPRHPSVAPITDVVVGENWEFLDSSPLGLEGVVDPDGY